MLGLRTLHANLLLDRATLFLLLSFLEYFGIATSPFGQTTAAGFAILGVT
jgi:hypothetical protein